MSACLHLGYLHIGDPSNGVTRYGLLLAEEAARRSMCVTQVPLKLTGAWLEDGARLAAAGEKLAAADVVHVQYSHLPQGSVWGGGWRRLSLLATFVRRLGRPVVSTIHDIGEVGRKSLRHGLSTRTIALRYLAYVSNTSIVCSETERQRLLEWAPQADVTVIPHMVEIRKHAGLRRDDAKEQLGLAGRTVVTLLGYIHLRKGYRLLLDALRYLPPEVHVVLAGQPVGGDSATSELRRVISEHGSRVRITGYLSDNELDTYLAATDLAVCPFRDMSASGSLSTWIAAMRPVLSSDLPQIAEYNRMAPGAIATFSPYTATALASRISEMLADVGGTTLSAMEVLRHSLEASRIFDKHMQVYEGASGVLPSAGANEARMMAVRS